MGGLFSIHPSGRSTINISVPGDNSISDFYMLSSADFREEQREKIVYSKGKLSGSIISSEASIADINLMFIVGGDTLEEIAVNVSALQSVFNNANGGYIEYRPVGYSDSVLTTFYRYLKSAPPERVDINSTYQAPNENKALGALYMFTIKIFALATSDPSSLQTVTAFTSVKNYTPGYLKIPDSSIKGDGLMPVIDVGLVDASLGGVNEAILHISPIDDAALGDDFLDANAFDDATTYDATDRWQWVGVNSGYTEYAIPMTSEKLFGRVTPLMNFKVISGAGQWEMRSLARMGSPSWAPLTDWQTITGTANDWIINPMDTIPYPLMQLPKTISTISALDASSMRFEFRTKDGNNYNLYFYGPIMAKSDGTSWIAQLDNTQDHSTDLTTVVYLHLDAFDGTSYMRQDEGSLLLAQSWRKKGMPVRDLILPKGTDYQLRVLLYDSSASGKGYYHTYPTNPEARVRGVYYTIYPFGES